MVDSRKDFINRDKVWMKYYSEEAKNAKLPDCTAYDYLKRLNKDRYDAPALHYYGNDITFGELVDRIEATAQAFCAAGVRPGDIVSFVSVQIPETIASIYALNKIGATANMIDPRMDVTSISRMITNSGSKVLVTLDIAWPKIKQIKSLVNQDLIITQSAATSLPYIQKVAMQIKSRTAIEYTADVITWKEFIKRGEGVVAVEVPYEGDTAVAITYTGGTTGFPKGVVLTNDSVNPVVINFKYCDVVHYDNDRYLGIIPVFSAYGLVCGMHMPLCLRMTLVPIPRFIPQQIGKLVRVGRVVSDTLQKSAERFRKGSQLLADPPHSDRADKNEQRDDQTDGHKYGRLARDACAFFHGARQRLQAVRDRIGDQKGQQRAKQIAKKQKDCRKQQQEPYGRIEHLSDAFFRKQKRSPRFF